MSPRVEEAVTALTGTSAPRRNEQDSWANALISGAQLVSVRILRYKSQRHITLNRKDQSLWPCAARRITTYLETGEVLADDDVTQMSDEELHRALDRPRRIRVDFYAHSNNDDSDKSEEDECDPRKLLDRVDEQ